MVTAVQHAPWLALLLLVGAERLTELGLSARNRRRALARGGVEHGAGHYPWMVALHVFLLVGSAGEVVFLVRAFIPALAAAMGALFCAATALRWWAIATLGERWSTRVFVFPGAPAVTGGPYRFLRHPNYVAVVLEGFALPMIHGAYLTALGFSAANALLLRVRIRVEETALAKTTDWGERFAGLR